VTEFADKAAFGAKLRESYEAFRHFEDLAREQYERDDGVTAPPKDLLERTTRRFIVDPFLNALDWSPDSIPDLTEEARARTTGDERLYFDYLGLDRATRTPILIVEAKGFDVEAPRRPYQGAPNANDMSALIAEAVDALKAGNTSRPVISAWAEFLGDMRTYVLSLGELGRTTLKRAVMSSGQWIIVFTDPWAVFGDTSPANVEHIRCYVGVEDILARKDELYDLLHRARLADTLGLMLTVAEALEMLDGANLGECFRAALVTTSTNVGASKQPFPTRLVYPALIVRTGERWFTITDMNDPVFEPKFGKADQIEEFLEELETVGARLETNLSRSMGRNFAPLPIEVFPGFEEPALNEVDNPAALAPLPGSTTHRRKTESLSKRFLTHTGSPGAPPEFVVVTGEHRFYKFNKQRGSTCAFHYWKDARNQGAAFDERHKGYILSSFTEDGQDRHCANAHVVSLRKDRCQLEAIETHLCCQACLFADICWKSNDDRGRLSCPPDAFDGAANQVMAAPIEA